MISLEELMRRCLELAASATDSGNYALGALVAVDGRIAAESASSLIGDDNDPSAHPEMVVIRETARMKGTRYLPGALLVTTLEPCPMCTSVAIWAKMAGIAFGATQQDAKSWSAEHPSDVYTWRQIAIPARAVVLAGEPALELHEGVLRDECRSLFSLTSHR
ncbi:nucleoside deaminase [Actinophytocola glycyrrhizae]|uniref:Nucleoside deaminase n=1 Tax=Actinophytocola glycyrrhizae TaxID=2044873 RepID=A0ABV9RY50_9PSEU